MLPQQMRRLPDRVGIDARNLGSASRETSRGIARHRERRPAGRRSARRGRRPRRCRTTRAGSAAIVRAWSDHSGPRVPRPSSQATKPPRRRRAPRRAASAVILAHQERAVGPVADEIGVEPALLDHHAGDRQRQRAIGAWPHPQPAIGLDRESDMARIDNDQLGAARARLGDPGRGGEQRGARIVAPQQDAAGLLVIRRADAGAGGEGAGELAVPGADLLRVAVVRRAEGVDQPVDPRLRIGNRGPGAGRDGKGHRLGAALGGDPAHRGGRLVERLIPGDPLPSGIGVALRPGAPQRIKQPVGRLDQRRARRVPWRTVPRRSGATGPARSRPVGRSRPPPRSRSARRRAGRKPGCGAGNSQTSCPQPASICVGPPTFSRISRCIGCNFPSRQGARQRNSIAADPRQPKWREARPPKAQSCQSFKLFDLALVAWKPQKEKRPCRDRDCGSRSRRDAGRGAPTSH